MKSPPLSHDTSFPSLTIPFSPIPIPLILLKQAVREAATMPQPHVTLTFDLLTLKVVSESHVTWATSVPILVFLGLSVLDLGPMYATDVRRQMSDRQTD